MEPNTTFDADGVAIGAATIRHTPSIAKVGAALAKAQGEITNATKDRVNPQFGAGFATLASVLEACREPLSKNEIALLQVPRREPHETDVAVTTRLLHSSGEWIECSISIPIFTQGKRADNSAQVTAMGMGSAITYGRRYGLMALVGIGAEDADDDGQAASGQGRGRQEAARQEAPRQEARQESRQEQPRAETQRRDWTAPNDGKAPAPAPAATPGAALTPKQLADKFIESLKAKTKAGDIAGIGAWFNDPVRKPRLETLAADDEEAFNRVIAAMRAHESV